MRSIIESRPVEIALKWEMGNEIDRVALQMGNETIESRSVEIALGNGKLDRSSREMRSIESRPVEIALKWDDQSEFRLREQAVISQ